MDIAARLKSFAQEFDRHFAALLQPEEEVPALLLEAMRYSALAPGKRVRPYLVMRACALVGGRAENVWPVAAAVECIHAFSLIHDDLPAMDDDDLRRGLPTCHRKFGEATAILAGDALSVLAFEFLARHGESGCATRLVLELARGAGWAGMIGGQTADVLGQERPADVAATKYIHERKTARLFVAACRMGALAGGGTEAQVDALGRYGDALGRAFQMADDLLDLTATAAAVGKEVGKDVAARKQTYPQCVGMEASRVAARDAVQDALACLGGFGQDADDLRGLAQFVVERDH